MKTTDKFLSAVVLTAAALCASCSTDDLAAQQQGQTETKAVSLTATIDQTLTRAGMSQSATSANQALFFWHEGDEILVQTQNSDGAFSGVKCSTKDATGRPAAIFSGDVATGETLGSYAVYPYNENHAFTGEKTLTYNLPATYTYTTVGTEIFSNTTDGTTTYPANSTNIPLYGTVANGTISFRYLGGLAVIRIDKMPFAEGTLTVSADQQLSGDFKVDFASATEMTPASTDTEADKQVTFTFSSATKGGVGVFYLPLATGEYTNLTLKISDSAGTDTQTVPYGTLSLSAANVWAISLTTDSNGKLMNIHSLGNGRYYINGYTFVDLGLPSGTLWAETNVGATEATDYGSYFAWGEIKTREKGTGWVNAWTWDTYQHGKENSLTKYYSGDNLTMLETSDDAAIANWGDFCRMPTIEEFAELISNCTWEWTTDGVVGYTVKGGDGSIFLPAAGYGQDLRYLYEGSNGYYWTVSRATKITGAVNLYFDSGSKTCAMGDGHARYCGLSVRPVAGRLETLQGETAESVNSNGFFEGWE